MKPPKAFFNKLFSSFSISSLGQGTLGKGRQLKLTGLGPSPGKLAIPLASAGAYF